MESMQCISLIFILIIKFFNLIISVILDFILLRISPKFRKTEELKGKIIFAQIFFKFIPQQFKIISENLPLEFFSADGS